MSGKDPYASISTAEAMALGGIFQPQPAQHRADMTLVRPDNTLEHYDFPELLSSTVKEGVLVVNTPGGQFIYPVARLYEFEVYPLNGQANPPAKSTY